jgi:hypothetical protein
MEQLLADWIDRADPMSNWRIKPFAVVVFAIALNVPGFTLIGQPAGADDALLKAPLVACASDKTVIGVSTCPVSP